MKKREIIKIPERERWWRCLIKNTPDPGHYKVKSNLDLLESQSASCAFKSSSRLKNFADINTKKGQYLLPGAYSVDSFVDKIQIGKPSSSFTSIAREKIDKKRKIKKIVELAEKKTPLIVDRQQKLSWYLKSKIIRLPSKEFLPKAGPAPGLYEVHLSKIVPIKSSFVSKTERFKVAKNVKTPGPGTYDKIVQYPFIKNLKKMSEKYGESQRLDANCRMAIQRCLNGRRMLSEAEYGLYWIIRNRLSIRDDSLVYTRESSFLVIMPVAKRRDVMSKYHEVFGGSHVGITKLVDVIRLSYFWPGIVIDIVDFNDKESLNDTPSTSF
ncbi:hypothetical protein A3Q56_00448 [Intoshia linei]|uniref:Integrase zinc-binding domain-containing protein n=1 Tax=Intoshia linei TaxID=1819745 RepID=A0A177BDH6_9BILA|nr:hypothetical protein A3Q56_00448 [Intoshia linei]